MRQIDFELKTPMDDNLVGWKPWLKEEWDNWLTESTRLLTELAKLDSIDAKEERNKFIDANSDHWGKLKPWLKALSHGKCWYTEGREICSHFDVEHFRPKKEAGNGNGTYRDAYWWLAFDYSNYRLSGNVPNRKKGSLFPLHQNSLVSDYASRCEESEIPFLLDPTSPHDPLLLAFDEEGNATYAPYCDDWEKLRVEESIKILKLNEHDALPSERRRVWQTTSKLIEKFLDAKSKYNAKTNPAPRVTMEETARQLREMTRANAELSMVAIWCAKFRADERILHLVTG
jgi:uncharacterized protein (TIGR02646 family)